MCPRLDETKGSDGRRTKGKSMEKIVTLNFFLLIGGRHIEIFFLVMI